MSTVGFIRTFYLVDRKRIELLPEPCKGTVLPLSLTAHNLVRRERLELSILAALASKTSVYTIPPPTRYLYCYSFCLLPSPLRLWF